MTPYLRLNNIPSSFYEYLLTLLYALLKALHFMFQRQGELKIMSFSRNSYHTDIKIAFKLNLLPENLSRKIPKTTKHRFKNSDFSALFGIDYANTIQSNTALIREIVKSKNIMAVLKAVIRVKKTVIKLKSSVHSQFDKMKQIVSTIQNVKDSIGLERSCRLFNLSRSQFFSWLHQVSHLCFDSFIQKCIRRWPNQLSVSTLKKMESLLNDERYNGWPIGSIALESKMQRRAFGFNRIMVQIRKASRHFQKASALSQKT